MLEKKDEKDIKIRIGLLYACISGSDKIIKMLYEWFDVNIE